MRLYLKLILAFPIVGVIVFLAEKLNEAIGAGVITQLRGGNVYFQLDSPFNFWFSVFAHGIWILAGLVILYRLFIGDPLQRFISREKIDDQSDDR